MKRKELELQDVALIVVIGMVAAIALIVVVLAFVDRQIQRGVTYKDVDMAAWVQAVGSVLAIIATGGGVWWSHQLEKRREQLAEAARSQIVLTHLYALMDESLAAIRAMLRAISNKNEVPDEKLLTNAPIVARSLREFRSAFEQVSHTSYPSQGALRALIQFRAAIAECIRILELATDAAAIRKLQQDLQRNEHRMAVSASAFHERAELPVVNAENEE